MSASWNVGKGAMFYLTFEEAQKKWLAQEAFPSSCGKKWLAINIFADNSKFRRGVENADLSHLLITQHYHRLNAGFCSFFITKPFYLKKGQNYPATWLVRDEYCEIKRTVTSSIHEGLFTLKTDRDDIFCSAFISSDELDKFNT